MQRADLAQVHELICQAISIKKQNKNRRYNLDEWLEAALEALASKGPEILSIQKLCDHLDLSRGSFYWHFKNREDFISKLVHFWDQRMTTAIAEALKVHPGDSSEKLMFLGELVIRTNAARYDIAIRAWSALNPVAAAAVKRTDKTRYDVIEALFAEMGFSGNELKMRARTFMTYYSMDAAVTISETKKERLAGLKLRHRLLTRVTDPF